MSMLKKLIVHEQAQGVAEYALILSGICLLVFAFVYMLGERLAAFYSSFIR